MSTSETISMECPGCGEKQDVEVWQLLNCKTDPEVKDALYGWKINVFNCAKCQFQAQLPIRLLYHDPDRRFCVQYYPVDALGSEEFYSGFTRSGEPLIDLKTEEAPEYMLKPHLVFDMAEMMRYIVFREVAFEKGREK